MVSMAYNVLKSPKELRPHNLNVEIYGNESIDMDLVESIKNKGILEPLVIRDDNIILSGHRRWVAAKHLKLDRIPCRTITFDNDLDEKEAMIEFNRQREKTPEQRVREGKTLKVIYAERARLKQLSQLNNVKETIVVPPTLAEREGKKIGNEATLPPMLTEALPETTKPKASENETRNKVADEVGMKRTNYTKVEVIVDKADNGDKIAREVLDKLNNNEVTVNAAHETLKILDKAKEGNEKAKKILPSVLKGETTPRKALNDIKKIEENKSMPKIETPPLPVDKFDVIYVDPPWKYDFTETGNREIENHYQTMELEEIKNLPVPAANDSVVLMWATMPKLIEALDLMEFWGFKYLTGAVWDKEKIGMGYWFRGQHELLLVGKKGNYSPPIPENRFSSVIRETRTTHSKKPDCVYEMIEKMFPDGKYLEMFARKRHNDKWTVWGNEV